MTDRNMSTPSVRPSLTYNALVGRVVQQIRKDMKIDQAVVAAALEISQPGYSKLESGGSTMSLPQLRKIAKTLGMQSSTLLARIEQYENQLRLQGVLIIESRDSTASQAALGLGLAFLVGLMAG